MLRTCVKLVMIPGVVYIHAVLTYMLNIMPRGFPKYSNGIVRLHAMAPHVQDAANAKHRQFFLLIKLGIIAVDEDW